MRTAQSMDVPAHVDLAFEDGTPIAVNGIPMSREELSESLATIALDHGFDVLASARAMSDGFAESVVSAAREALVRADQAASGVVRLVLHHGERTVVHVSPAPPAHPA